MVADSERIPLGVVPTGDTEAIQHLRSAIAGDRHWFIALLEAMGMWVSTEEKHNGRTYRYLVDGEAFDWLLLAERLCEAADGIIPAGERDALLFSGKPPLCLSATEVERALGSCKYHQYLNFFYGITVEEFLSLAAQEETYKEKSLSSRSEQEIVEEAFEKVYGESRASLLKRFRQEKGYSLSSTTGLTEQKEFTYWLFKFRVRTCEKARVASDTRKGLRYLQRQREGKKFWGGLVTGGPEAG